VKGALKMTASEPAAITLLIIKDSPHRFGNLLFGGVQHGKHGL
jgi:hypothetical protein